MKPVKVNYRKLNIFDRKEIIKETSKKNVSSMYAVLHLEKVVDPRLRGVAERVRQFYLR